MDGSASSRSSSSGSDAEDDTASGVFPVELITSEGRGRDYIASRAIASNELVLRVAPVAAVPNDRFATSVCSGCFRRGCSPCHGCQQAALCETCAVPGTRSAALHRDECAALRMLFGSAQTRRLEAGANAANSGGRAGVRLLLRLLHTRQRQRAAADAVSGDDDASWPELREPEDCDVIEDEIHDVWDLEDHWEDLSDEVADRLVDMSKQAKYVLSAEMRGNLEEYTSLLSHCYCNAFKLPGRGDDRTRLAPQSVGVGVFVSASFFNHSCRPNCRFALDESGFLEITACRDVEQGELLTISYIPLDHAARTTDDAPAHSRDARRERLRNDFFFECACELCQEEAAHVQAEVPSPNSNHSRGEQCTKKRRK